MRFSQLTHLECSRCQREFQADQLINLCPDCSSPLLARYDLQGAARQMHQGDVLTRAKGMWRWHELLPVQNPEAIVTLGEGDTPMIKLPHLGNDLGLSDLILKDESLNPTGTFKARGQAAAISRAKELGAQRVIIPTAGNAGGAMAAYAARAGMQARVVMPADTPRSNIEECRAVGAEVELVDGLISDASRIVSNTIKEGGWFDISTFKEPYRLEGKKIMGYELAEYFGWRLPDVILYPAGGGMGLAAIWKAVAELQEMGWLVEGPRPRMVAVQAEGCAPVVRAFQAGERTNQFWENARTIASGLRVPKSFGDRLMMDTIYESNGTAIAVSDEQIKAGQIQLGRTEGVFAAPEGAAMVAALPILIARGWLDPDECIVLLNTGTGLKYI